METRDVTELRDTEAHPATLVRAGQLVELHRHIPGNLAAFQRWYADDEITYFLRHDLRPLNERQSQSYFDTLILPLSARGFGWAIVESATGRLIGTTALTDVNTRTRSALFRIVLGERDTWSRGYGTEATRLVCEEGFATHGLREIRLEVFTHNPRAIGAYERVGFQRTGQHVEYVPDRQFDLHVVEMTLRRADYDHRHRARFASVSPIYGMGNSGT